MTKEEIIKGLEDYIPWADEYEVDIEVLTGALELLKKEPCNDANANQHNSNALNDVIQHTNALEGDLISRQAVIDALTKTSGIRGDALKALYDLPPVTPQEPKTGHWIKENPPMVERYPFCSECGFVNPFENTLNYCPNCGAKMVEPQESEDKE